MTQLLVVVPGSDYMILLPNGILCATEVKKLGPHNTQIIFKSDWKFIGPSKYINNYLILIMCQNFRSCM